MAIRLASASSQYLSRSTDILDFRNPYTIAGWFRLVSDTNNYSHFLQIYETASNVDDLGTDADGTTLGLYVGNTGTFVAGSALSVGTWYYLALVRESTTSLKAYLGILTTLAALDITNTGSVASRAAPSVMRIGTWDGAAEFTDARGGPLKAWATALTLDEVRHEQWTIVPRRLSNLYAWWPCFPGSTERLADYSAAGRHWTANGTLTDEDPPPVGWGVLPLWLPFAPSAAAPVPPRPRILQSLYRN
jgi:hypothetical protein